MRTGDDIILGFKVKKNHGLHDQKKSVRKHQLEGTSDFGKVKEISLKGHLRAECNAPEGGSYPFISHVFDSSHSEKRYDDALPTLSSPIRY
jgi:hypothetical protein